MATEIEAQVELYLALEAHKFDLEITRGVTALDQEILDRRVEAVQRLLESLSQAIGLDPPASQPVETPPPSSAQADLNQIPPRSLILSRARISHSSDPQTGEVSALGEWSHEFDPP
jgi:hypothetical protein